MRLRKNAAAERIQQKAAWIREFCRPYTPEQAKQEAEDVQRDIRVHGINAFSNPMFVDRVRWVMTQGFQIEFPTDEEFVRIARI